MSETITAITKTKGDLSDAEFGRKYWNEKAMKMLEGAKIIAVEYMPQKETEDCGWYQSPITLCIEKNGKQSWIIPMCDDEGNDGGSLNVGGDILPVL